MLICDYLHTQMIQIKWRSRGHFASTACAVRSNLKKPCKSVLSELSGKGGTVKYLPV
jgi:hypothetical protein